MHRFSKTFPFTILIIALTGCSFSLAGDITPPPGAQLPPPQKTPQSLAVSSVYPIVPPDPSSGRKIYEQECTQCHGEKGLGDGPQAAQLSVQVATLGLTDFARQYTPAEWYTVISKGNMEKFMPAFLKLTDRQRWDVVAYAMSLSAPDQLVSQGKALYDGNCIDCHGTAGSGNGPDAPTLTTRPTDFTNQAFMSQRSAASLYQAITDGVAPDMPAYTNTLDDNARWALVSYLRTLTFIAQPSSQAAYPAQQASPSIQPTNAAYTSAASYPSPGATQAPSITSTTVVTPTVKFLGTVTVQLINGSGGDAPTESPVTLYGFDDMQNTYSETLKIGENGIYTFTNVIMPEGRVFLAGTDFASGKYVSDIIAVNPATPNLNLQITVYDSTTDVSLLTTDRVHIFFDFTDPQNVMVSEVFIISNPTKQAVVAATPGGSVVTFPLPKGFTNLQFQNTEDLGTRYLELSQGFADRMTVNPGVGQYQVVFAFQMPYNRTLQFSQPMFLPTSAEVVMVPDNGIKVSSSMLQEGDTRDYKGTSYRMYNGSSLLAGGSLDFTLSGSPKQATPSFFSAGTIQNFAIGLGVFGVALVMAGVWLFRRNQRRLALQQISPDIDIAASISDMNASSEDEETLMDAIIALDDQFHAGNLPQEAYMERRAVLKEKLRNINHG